MILYALSFWGFFQGEIAIFLLNMNELIYGKEVLFLYLRINPI